MAVRILKCSMCEVTDEVWSFQTAAMKKKIYLCWPHLKEVEAKAEERGEKNKYK